MNVSATPTFGQRALQAPGLRSVAMTEAARSILPTHSERTPTKTQVATPTLSDAEQQERLVFDHLSNLKVLTSKIAMHLMDGWRSGIFAQLDNLLDADAWDFDDPLPSDESFRTFLKTLVHISPKKRPGLGATAEGNIVAAWTDGADRLTIECQPGDRARWVLVKHVDGERVSAAGTTPAEKLPAYLAPYDPDGWFHGRNQSR